MKEVKENMWSKGHPLVGVTGNTWVGHSTGFLVGGGMLRQLHKTTVWCIQPETNTTKSTEDKAWL